MIDVTALGEILIDFTPEGEGADGFPIYTANPGGAPGNVLVSLAQLGRRTEFMGCVGEDQFGKQLEQTLQHKNVGTNGLVYSDIHTTLAFVHLDETGDRSFSFCRNPGADIMLRKEDLQLDLITQSKIFHVGSISMTDNPVRDATLTALSHAKEKDVYISFDPNLRPPLWEDLQIAKESIEKIMHYAHIVKVSEEELEFLTGEKNIEQAAKMLYEKFNLKLLFVTVGAEGSYVIDQNQVVFSPGIPVQVKDTTGCGDAFFAGVLYQLLKNDFFKTGLSMENMKDILSFGNAMGAYVAQYKGGMPAMPILSEIENFMLKNAGQ